MRAIKFRAYDKGIGTWSFFDLDNIEQDESYRTYLGGMKKNDNTIIEQYTGLKDKNGREIYEGDIIDCGIRNLPYVVDWIYKYCMFFPFGKEKIMMEVYNSGNEIKVIGNIHENPELLEGKNDRK